VEIEFDPAKDAKNVRERGLSLDLGSEVLMNLVTETEDIRHEYGERRMIAFGTIAGRLFCVVYTLRGDALHIISVRKANKMEIRKWLGTDR
jgi:uncharacterized DUF497 family protein